MTFGTNLTLKIPAKADVLAEHAPEWEERSALAGESLAGRTFRVIIATALPCNYSGIRYGATLYSVSQGICIFVAGRWCLMPRRNLVLFQPRNSSDAYRKDTLLGSLVSAFVNTRICQVRARARAGTRMPQDCRRGSPVTRDSGGPEFVIPLHNHGPESRPLIPPEPCQCALTSRRTRVNNEAQLRILQLCSAPAGLIARRGSLIRCDGQSGPRARAHVNDRVCGVGATARIWQRRTGSNQFGVGHGATAEGWGALWDVGN